MDHPNDAFMNQDILRFLTIEELRELSNLKEMRRSLTATITYLEGREGTIFKEARTRKTSNEASSD